MHRSPGPVAGSSSSNVPVMSPTQFKTLMDTYAAAGMQPAAQGAGGDGEVNSTAVKLPNFWANDPELWFFQVEAVFENRTPKVTVDSTKFNHAMAAIPQDVLNTCRGIIQLPPNTPDRYQQLKTALTDSYSKTESQRHAELIEFAAAKEPIIDIKPSALMMHVSNLAGNDIAALIRAMFLNRMPQEVRTVLSSSTAANNKDFAKEANGVLAEYLLARNLSPATNSISSLSRPVIVRDDVGMEEGDIAAVYRPRQQPHSTPFRGPRPAAPAVPFLCYVHARYGQQAYSCRSASCPMRNQVKRPPGNSKAGRQ